MHVVDILIIITFLIATLYIGFSSGKKIKTLSDYAIGNRKFSDFAIYCTVTATAIGGTAVMGNVGKFYEVGIVQSLAQIGLPITYIIMGLFLVQRFGDYYGCCSMGDMFYRSYGIIISAFIGLSTFVLWNLNIKPITQIDGLFPGFFANIITILFFYFLGGRQKVFSKEELARMRQAEALQFKKKPSVRELQMRNLYF